MTGVPGPRPDPSWGLVQRRLFYVDELAARLGLSPARLDVGVERHPGGRRSPRPVNVLADLATCLAATCQMEEALGTDAVQEFWTSHRPHPHRAHWASRLEQRALEALSRPHDRRADLLSGRVEEVVAEALSFVADRTFAPETPGTLYDPNRAGRYEEVSLGEWMCDEEDLPLFRSLSVGSRGWTTLDPGTRLEFVVRSLSGGEGEGVLTGVVHEVAAAEAWSAEWDWARAAAPEALKDPGWYPDAPHPYSPLLWSGPGAARLAAHRLRGLHLYALDAVVWVRHHQASAMSGYLSGPFAQWPWLRPFAPTLTRTARRRRRVILSRMTVRPTRWGLARRPSASGPLPIPVWFASWFRPRGRADTLES